MDMNADYYSKNSRNSNNTSNFATEESSDPGLYIGEKITKITPVRHVKLIQILSDLSKNYYPEVMRAEMIQPEE